MATLKVYIAAEDSAARAVVRRLLSVYCGEYEVINSIPARGGQLKSRVPALNNLSASAPVILLMDLDAEYCAPCLKEKMMAGFEKSPGFIFNIAYDEVESWLFADKVNLSNYLGVPTEIIPDAMLTRQNGPKEVYEVCCPVKASLYLTHNIARQSSKKEIRDYVAVNPSYNAVKGPNYNDPIVSFIEKIWDPEEARKHSDSLNRMICRIETLKID